MSDNIAALSDLSRKLNEASDRINQAISKINAKLEALNLGVEVWLSHHPLEASEQEEVWLGYCEVEGEWQLAAMLRTCDWDGPIEDAPEESIKEDFRPLLKVGRRLRLDALSLIPELADELKQRAESLLDRITKAERTAERL